MEIVTKEKLEIRLKVQLEFLGYAPTLGDYRRGIKDHAENANNLYKQLKLLSE